MSKERRRSESNSSFSETLDTTGQRVRYDNCVKRILSVKIILARILQGCTTEFENLSVDYIAEHCIENDVEISMVAVDQDVLDRTNEERGEQIEGLNTEDVTIREGKIFYDLRFSATAPGLKGAIKLIINVEAQNDAETERRTTKRAIYYLSRMISAQKNRVFKKRQYEKIRKVYSIWILTDPAKSKKNTITRYRIIEEPLVGAATTNKGNYDLMTAVMIRLGDPDKSAPRSLLQFLNLLLSPTLPSRKKQTELAEKFNIKMTSQVEEEMETMCSLAEGIERKAEAKGKAEGLKEGEKRGEKRGERRGEKRGEERATLDHAMNLMKSLKLTAEEALKAIGVPVRKRKALLNSINERLATE